MTRWGGLLSFLIWATTAWGQESLQTPSPPTAIPTPAPSAEPSPPVTAPWKFGGDGRLRYEVDTQRPHQPNRERGRIRFRLRAEGGVTPEATMGFMVRTGDPRNPVQANYSFANSLKEPEGFGVVLDTAYLRYTPDPKEPFTVCVGQSPQQFHSLSPLGKLIWDTDYNPVGLWVGWLEIDQEVTLGTYLLERTANARVHVLESRHRWDLGDGKLVLELELNHFDNLAQGVVALNRGNATVDRNKDGKPDAFLSDFTLFSPALIYDLNLGEVPVQLTAQYIRNLSAATGRCQAYAFGISVGPNKKAGDISCTYRYHYIDQDALFTPPAQDDITLASNFRGHVGGVRYTLSPSTQLDLWLLTATPMAPPGPTQYRYRLDMGWKL